MRIGRPESDYTKPIKRVKTEEELEDERDIQENTCDNVGNRGDR